MFQYIEPEVSGELGEDTEMDVSVHPPHIYSLHYEFHGWLGNDIIESFPCYVVTERLKTAIEHDNLAGVEFDKVKITLSEEFQEMQPYIELPIFYWMKVKGEAGKDDFGIGRDFRLVISEKVQKLMTLFNVSEATFEEYADAYIGKIER